MNIAAAKTHGTDNVLKRSDNWRDSHRGTKYRKQKYMRMPKKVTLARLVRICFFVTFSSQSGYQLLV